MANGPLNYAHHVHRTDLQSLVEKIIRTRIYESKYWQEECFGLTDELLADKATELRSVGGVYGPNIQPTPFLCLTLKMLQIQPEKAVVVEFIRNEDFKYVRALAAFYVRLTGTVSDCNKYLGPLLNDYRKMTIQNRNGDFEQMRVNEFIHRLLHSERVCDIRLPQLQKRRVLKENGPLGLRINFLREETEDVNFSEEEDTHPAWLETNPSRYHRRQTYRDWDSGSRSPTLCWSPARSRSPARCLSQSQSPGRRSPTRCWSPARYLSRKRSRSPERSRSRARSLRYCSLSKSPGHQPSHRHSKSPETLKKNHRNRRLYCHVLRTGNFLMCKLN
ncbi:pre-mRNA-splicing factor 38A-like [Antechinus flavipes]|uniref:pre-mRNA-splicing factor 38A-like n=1 Tax=Antechinus flavipes TaxID=38775 RepID=UPI0022357D80|nr:pre-mRNA-splicing factor 38A-like [Antechinus flavipes]